MSFIEPLEPRIAPAAGLTVTHLPGGALNFTTTEGADTIFIRSDEPGWISFGTQTGDLVVDGETKTGTSATIAMPKGAVTVDLLGGDDQLLLHPMVLPGSLTVNDPAGVSHILMTGLVVKGSLTMNGSADNDLIVIDGMLRVGKDFVVNFGAGTDDVMRNEARGLSFSVGGSMRVHGDATNTVVALGLDENGHFARTTDTPLALRELRIGRDFVFESTSSLASVLLHSASTRVGGKFSATATAANGSLDVVDISDGPLSIVGGVAVKTAGGADVAFEGLSVSVGIGITFDGGPGDDTFSIFGNAGMKLPKTTLVFGDGKSETLLRAHDPWTLTGSISATAGAGNDKFDLQGPGKVTGSVTGDFGAGQANVTLNGDGTGRMTIGTLLRETSQDGINVGIFNSTVLGVTNVIGKTGADALFIDSSKFVGAVTFTGGAGSDGFLVDNQTRGYITPSAFLGAVNVDLGADGDGVIIGTNTPIGYATFFGSVAFKGIAGETYTVAPQPFVVFKKNPLLS